MTEDLKNTDALLDQQL